MDRFFFHAGHLTHITSSVSEREARLIYIEGAPQEAPQSLQPIDRLVIDERLDKSSYAYDTVADRVQQYRGRVQALCQTMEQSNLFEDGEAARIQVLHLSLINSILPASGTSATSAPGPVNEYATVMPVFRDTDMAEAHSRASFRGDTAEVARIERTNERTRALIFHADKLEAAYLIIERRIAIVERTLQLPAGETFQSQMLADRRATLDLQYNAAERSGKLQTIQIAGYREPLTGRITPAYHLLRLPTGTTVTPIDKNTGAEYAMNAGGDVETVPLSNGAQYLKLTTEFTAGVDASRMHFRFDPPGHVMSVEKDEVNNLIFTGLRQPTPTPAPVPAVSIAVPAAGGGEWAAGTGTETTPATGGGAWTGEPELPTQDLDYGIRPETIPVVTPPVSLESGIRPEAPPPVISLQSGIPQTTPQTTSPLHLDSGIPALEDRTRGPRQPEPVTAQTTALPDRERQPAAPSIDVSSLPEMSIGEQQELVVTGQGDALENTTILIQEGNGVPVPVYNLSRTEGGQHTMMAGTVAGDRWVIRRPAAGGTEYSFARDGTVRITGGRQEVPTRIIVRRYESGDMLARIAQEVSRDVVVRQPAAPAPAPPPVVARENVPAATPAPAVAPVVAEQPIVIPEPVLAAAVPVVQPPISADALQMAIPDTGPAPAQTLRSGPQNNLLPLKSDASLR